MSSSTLDMAREGETQVMSVKFEQILSRLSQSSGAGAIPLARCTPGSHGRRRYGPDPALKAAP